MKEKTVKVIHEDAGARIDTFVALSLGDEYSRTYVKHLIEKGLVLVNGSGVKPHYSIKGGDEIRITIPPQEEVFAEPQNIPVCVVYEDEDIIVIDKQAGMVVHPGAGNKTGTLVNALIGRGNHLADTGDPLRPGIVHRLDKDTSGLIVVAKNDRAHRSLGKQFQKRAVKKRYLAIVRGIVEMDNGVVDAPIARDFIDRKKMEIEFSSGRSARTIYHVIKRYVDFTFVAVEPETGRTHQIRVHMKHLGHPLLGDVKYGCPQGMARHALHAEMLGFTHPVTGKYIEFRSPLPEDMKNVLERGSIK